ncbi:Mrp/NBP35 family ATP-binding protein [Alisedimentitalea sp. MJ-SS2]|uniref:Mrp/NBP35 family ATP-binding protein n=1 Tax=Aliisedimentitalea sp. MJ-SS2 TaxID=3049795 RepID=UPI002909FF97|nr:Mrp/NBP35 family ATP-binding protein [Alisedimentitalea sp. MJ-SS2]MDU8926306.1 Mrp/NBP35 family ATP-binding protein [Alisedimentitalea sp. MJ-SS2]
MGTTRETILEELNRIQLPEGGTLVSKDMIKALNVDGDQVRFVIEAATPEDASKMEAIREAAVKIVGALDGVSGVSAVLTAHGPSQQQQAAPPPNLKVGQHPQPQEGKILPPGVKKIIAVGSGKGGVGKSTVSANIAVALAKAGKKVGLLDADIYGPSQPRMMGIHQRPQGDPEGKLLPPEAYGIKVMSIGLLLEEGQAVVWRGPMLIGTLQQFLTDVNWGELDVLVVDLPPGTGDVLLTLGQKSELSGVVMVSTPQDVALIDARKGIDMLNKMDIPVIGMVENMSVYHCPKCGHEEHVFGHGGVKAEAEKIGAPLLAQLPIDLETRVGGDEGRPVAAGEGVMAGAYAALAGKLIAGGVV